jgi:hypothetical protein
MSSTWSAIALRLSGPSASNLRKPKQCLCKLQRATSVDDVFILPAFLNFHYYFMEDKLTMGHARQPKRRLPRGQNRQVKVKGGELHQQAGPAEIPLTTNQGLALSDNQNSLRAGDLGPSLLEDFILHEKITHFDHERTPE